MLLASRLLTNLQHIQWSYKWPSEVDTTAQHDLNIAERRLRECAKHYRCCEQNHRTKWKHIYSCEYTEPLTFKLSCTTRGAVQKLSRILKTAEHLRLVSKFFKAVAFRFQTALQVSLWVKLSNASGNRLESSCDDLSPESSVPISLSIQDLRQ